MIVLLSSLAFAGDAQDLAKSCMDRYKSDAAIATCMSEPRFAQIEVAQAQIEERLDDAELADTVIFESLEKLRASIDKLISQRASGSPPASPAPTANLPARPSNGRSGGQPTTSTPSASFAVVGGVPYRTVARPSLVSIYQISGEVDTLNVTDLARSNSYKRCGGTSTSRVIVTNHGIPTPVWTPPGALSGFIEVYADLNGDGEADVTPYKVLDPSRQSGFVATWRSGDELQVTYLRESGEVLQIQGLPLQTVWRKPSKSDGGLGILGCDMSPHEPRGGHRATPAYNMSQVW
ncbi:MAG: hypothetical protein WC654_04710 [Patescibacteria group bacterium]